MYSCKEVARLTSESRDRKLGLFESIQLRIHRWMCPPCERHGKQIAVVNDAASTLDADDTGCGTSKLSDSSRERLRERLKQGS